MIRKRSSRSHCNAEDCDFRGSFRVGRQVLPVPGLRGLQKGFHLNGILYRLGGFATRTGAGNKEEAGERKENLFHGLFPYKPVDQVKEVKPSWWVSVFRLRHSAYHVVFRAYRLS